MDFDRQAIERRDFPVSRRGYEPAAVDAHLRALAAEFDELQRKAAGGEPSLATAAASQVQSILRAAETAAEEIKAQALEHANGVREAADADALRTREEAIGKARAHVAAVADATAALLERARSLDGEVSALLDSVRTGGGRLAGDLAALEQRMGDLYDAASGPPPLAGGQPQQAPVPSQTAPGFVPQEPAVVTPEPAAGALPVAPGAPAKPAAPAGAQPDGGDLDGARLVALNMALNGQSREEAEQYLREHYQSIDRLKLIDEVYAAIDA